MAGGSLVLAGGLYLLERRALQQGALFVALAATLGAVGEATGWPWEVVGGYGFMALGAGWLELGRRGLVGPRRSSEALGALALLAGPQAVASAGPWGYLADRGLWLGLVVTVALIVAGSALRRPVPLGLGAAAMLVFLGQLAGQHWRDLGVPLAVLLVGLGLVAAAAVLARPGRRCGAAREAAPQVAGVSRGRRSGR